MSADRWTQISSLFAQAVEFPLSERQQFLERVCRGDESLRQELESLLANDAPDQRLVDIPAEFIANCSDNRESAADMAGRRIGPYRLISLIGHGGMGAVYLGVRADDQYQKQVAIKLLKHGMDTDLMLSRFRRERQILANLEHPFIARMMDGGATEDGLPYFVMEYVEGVPIAKYCADKGLSVPERLRLFRMVCEAVQYAHQNLVVHRDIKPSNILTTEEGIPKLLDFGIAKLLDSGTAENVTLTQFEVRMLTPDYASPEQIKGQPIGTASDIYSLGAVLYELLARRRAHRFTTSSIAEFERIICETEAERPSSVAARNDELSANLRQQLSRQISGDLDNIVLTAMRKEPQCRYASAAELSDDLRRHMESLPILAQEDRRAYRARKFIRRNRLAVGAALLVTASLVGGIVTTSVQARRAERRFELARQLARAVVADIKGPLERLPGSTAARASMIQTVLRYLDGLAEDPGRDSAFALEIADAYREVANVEGHPLRENLGQVAAALTHYQKAIAIYERYVERAETKTHALSALIGTNLQAGDIEIRNGNAAAAQARLQRMVSIASDATARDSAAVAPDSWIYLYFRLGDVESRRGEPEEALRHYRQALEVCKGRAAIDDSASVRSDLRGAYVRVADAQKQSGDLIGARETYLTALRTAEEVMRLPDARVYDRSMLSYGHQTLGNLLGNPGEPNLNDRQGALSHARKAVEMAEAITASDQQNVRAVDDLSGAYRSLAAILLEERPDEALKWYKKAASISQKLTSSDPSNTNFRHSFALSHLGIGESLLKLGRNREALENLAPALAMFKSLTGIARDQIFLIGELGTVHRAIGTALVGSGDEAGALENYRQALATSEALVQRAPSSLYFRLQRADSLEFLGRYYATLARRKRELKAEARLWLQKSLVVWQDWKRRQIAPPYAITREAQLTTFIALIDEM